MTITIPHDLHDRVGAAQPKIDLTAVAVRAFATTLDAIDAGQMTMTTGDAAAAASMGDAPQKPVRRSVMVPHDVKARMGAVGRQVCWSAVASRAIAAELAPVKAKRGKKTDMTPRGDWVRALYALRAEEAREAGRERGDHWALRQATLEELERLGRFPGSEEAAKPGWQFEQVVMQADVQRDRTWAGQALFMWLHPESSCRAADLDQFWERVLGDQAWQMKDCNFALGFAEGALRRWMAWRSRR
jgi:hypothetical protein